MRLHLQPLPDDSNVAAIMYGPLVLAGELGTQNLDPPRLYSEDKYLHGGFPAVAVPELAGNRDALDQWIHPVNASAGVPGSPSGSPLRSVPATMNVKPLTFRTVNAGHPEEITLSPFYRLFDQRYCVYWRFCPAVNG
jgi:hypothetical protein